MPLFWKGLVGQPSLLGLRRPEAAKGKSAKSKANQLDITELVIDLYNGVRSTNLKTGSLKPKSIPVLASNFDIEEVER